MIRSRPEEEGREIVRHIRLGYDIRSILHYIKDVDLLLQANHSSNHHHHHVAAGATATVQEKPSSSPTAQSSQ